MTIKGKKGREYPAFPQVAVGAIVIKDGKVLLVKRGNPPGKGLWAIPGGRVRVGETLKEATEREIKEETGIIIRARKPIYPFDVILKDSDGRVQFHYVILDFMGDYISGNVTPGDDVNDARWFSAYEIKEIPVTKTTLDILKEVPLFEF